MNKVVLGVIAVVVLGAIVYFATANKDAETTQNNNETTNTTQTEETNTPTTQKGSIKNLASQGTQQCTYKDEAGTSTGTIYTNNGKARMDIAVTASGTTFNSHSIIDGTTYYSWVDGQPTGFKMTIDSTTPPAGAGTTQSVDVNKEIDYTCSSWSVDASKFVLPANIQFTDMNSFKAGM